MRKIKFKYDLYDKNEKFKKTLKNIQSCNVRYASLGQLKGSATITLTEDKDINFLTDRIKINCIIDNKSYSLGIYLLSSNGYETTDNKSVREVTCYSKLLLLTDAKAKKRYVVNAGTNVITEVQRILQRFNLDYVIEDAALKLQSSKEWKIGTSYLQIINDLLSIINYNSLRVNPDGKFVTEPYVLPIDREVQYVLKDDDTSIIYPGQNVTEDTFNIPNIIILTTNNADINPPLRSVYENHNPDSILSIENRGREIIYFEEVEDVPNQQILNELAKKKLYEKSDIYSHIELATAIKPEQFGYLNCIYLKTKDFNNKHTQTVCEIECKAGGKMTRSLRRVIKI